MNNNGNNQGYGAGGPGWNPEQGFAPGHDQGGYGFGAQRHVDALDVLEGVLTNGFSLSSLTRIARARGSKFWLGAAIGAGVVVLANRPDVRAAMSGLFGAAKSMAREAAAENTEPAAEAEAEPAPRARRKSKT